MTYYTERDGRYYRAGLVYESFDDGRTFHFEPDGPFFVDGIRYAAPIAHGCHIQPMVELKCEVIDDTVPRYPPTAPRPPLTDDELDEWVRHG